MDESRHQSFSGLFRFTYRIWRANLWSLVTVSTLACAVALLAAALIEGTHTIFSFTDTALGVTLNSSGSGTISSTSLGLERAMTFTGLITIATGAWATATMVVMLLRHARDGRRAKLADLACGLRYWPWVVLVALLDRVIVEVMHVATEALLTCQGWSGWRSSRVKTKPVSIQASSQSDCSSAWRAA